MPAPIRSAQIPARTPGQSPLLLVDGHNLLWRAAYGFPGEIRSRDKTRDLTGVFGFFALLRVAIRDELDEDPEVLVVFDGEHGAADRQDADAAYKANRALDDGARKALEAIPAVQRGLDLHGLAWIEIDTAEADDVIATLISRTRSADQPARRPVWIMSTDRDYYQLLDAHVRVLNTAMHPGKRRIGPDEVAARYDVRPAQWPCFVALKGDPADNIPGVRGIGATTAARLLANGLTLDGLPTSGRLTSTKGRLVHQHWQDVLAFRDLVRVRTDLPLPLTPTGAPSTQLPKPADVIEKLALW